MDLVLQQVADGMGTIMLNNPRMHNAPGGPLLDELIAGLPEQKVQRSWRRPV